MLVVLDNARDTAQVRPLLPGASTCLVVMTSRNQLTGLIAADGAHPVTLDLLTDDDARQLLARRLGAGQVAAEPSRLGRSSPGAAIFHWRWPWRPPVPKCVRVVGCACSPSSCVTAVEAVLLAEEVVELLLRSMLLRQLDGRGVVSEASEGAVRVIAGENAAQAGQVGAVVGGVER
jgi:hypothetical protein